MRLLVLLLLCASSAASADTIPEIWKARCKSCHGETGKADTKTGREEDIPDMTTAAWQKKWTDENVRKIILEGSKENRKMKPFAKKLSAYEVTGLIKFVRGLSVGATR